MRQRTRGARELHAHATIASSRRLGARRLRPRPGARRPCGAGAGAAAAAGGRLGGRRARAPAAARCARGRQRRAGIAKAEHAQQRHLESGARIGRQVQIAPADDGGLVVQLHVLGRE